MNFASFFKKSLALLLGIALPGAVVWQNLESDQARMAMLAGAGIAYGNAIIGFAIVSWGFKRSHRDFFLSFFGGMILRFLLIFVLLFVLIGSLKVNIFTLLATLMSLYFLFLGLEIFQLHKYSDLKRK
jgi:hypothetical protein